MKLDFEKSDGLITAVIQDHASGRVLMVGYMNEKAFLKTVETGFATFWSRSRKKLWLKGESSGHRLAVKEIFTDCDRDTVLIKAEKNVHLRDVARVGSWAASVAGLELKLAVIEKE